MIAAPTALVALASAALLSVAAPARDSARVTLALSPEAPVAGASVRATVTAQPGARPVVVISRSATSRSFRPTRIGPGRFRAQLVFPSAGRWTARVEIARRGFAKRVVLVRRPRPVTDPRFQEWNVTPGSHPHDVAPAPDGTVWYTEQFLGHLGRLDPRNGAIRRIALGSGSAPHGVIVGPDQAAWVTDQGLNAIVRVDGQTEEVRVFPMPPGTPDTAPNTGCFDERDRHWFTGNTGWYGVVEQSGSVQVWPAPRGPGPYGIACVPSGVYYASLQGSYVGRIDPDTGAVTVLEPPTRNQGARRIWGDSRGRLWVTEWNVGNLARYDPAADAWREWRLPGPNPQPYAVFVDARDLVWITDFGADALVRFNPTTERFTAFRWPSSGALVRQLLGRADDIWGAESGRTKLVVFRTG